MDLRSGFPDFQNDNIRAWHEGMHSIPGQMSISSNPIHTKVSLSANMISYSQSAEVNKDISFHGYPCFTFPVMSPLGVLFYLHWGGECHVCSLRSTFGATPADHFDGQLARILPTQLLGAEMMLLVVESTTWVLANGFSNQLSYLSWHKQSNLQNSKYKTGCFFGIIINCAKACLFQHSQGFLIPYKNYFIGVV